MENRYETEEDINENMKGKSTLPHKKFRAGPVIATIWQNEALSKDGTAYKFSTISIERGYKDKKGSWQNTSSMRLNDLPRAALVATKAYEYLVLNNAAESS
ncbi:hypothetical protein JXB31_04185 [Candidatus Woesearchaeota archaeon]|nr:hypothetical protein [Candidatus Woesearchaeota archaeon]